MADHATQGKLTSLVVPKSGLPMIPVNNQRRLTVGERMRFMISGVMPDGWMTPSQPMEPQEQELERKWDFPVGYNLNYIPRSGEPYSFFELRALAENCDVLRICLQAVIDQVVGDDWAIRVKPSQGYSAAPAIARPANGNISPNASTDQLDAIREISDFFTYPDKENDWEQWCRMLLEDMLVIDAATLYRRKTRGGKLYSLDVYDGATIKPLIDDGGRAPVPPDPAYQQVLKGIPAVDFTRDELIYAVRNRRSYKMFGFPATEQIMVTVNTAIRRAVFQMEYYRSGSEPDAFVGLPTSWNLESIKDFQKWFDSLLVGNLANRRKTRFMPGEFKYQETRQVDLKGDYDEWLARIICFTLGVDPQPFITHVARGTGQQNKERALEDGKHPRQQWVKKQVDRVIREDFKRPDLEFIYLEDREQDPSAKANIDVAHASNGLRPIDEIRAERGWPTFGGVFSKPMLKTATGYVFITGEPAVAAQPEGADGKENSTNTEDGPSEGGGNDDKRVKTKVLGEEPKT